METRFRVKTIASTERRRDQAARFGAILRDANKPRRRSNGVLF